MAYTKQTWADRPSKTTPINASRLGHIEDGIYDAAATADSAASAISNLGSAAAKDSTSAITEDSTDLVESGAVYTALEDKVDKTDIAQTLSSAVAPTGGLKSGEQFYLNGNLYTATTTISQGSAIVVYPTAGYNCKLSDSVTGQIAEQEQLLEDTVGWISDNQAHLYDWTGGGSSITFTYTKEQLTLNGTASANTSQPPSANVPEDGKYTLKAGTYKIVCDVANVYWEVVSLNPVSFITQDSKTFTITEDTVVFIRANIKSGASFNNKVVHVSLRKLSVDEQKADNSIIGTVEGATASQAYAVGEHFIKDGQFKEVTQVIASGGAINDSNTVDKPIADLLKPITLPASDALTEISIDGTVKYAHKYGKIVICKIRFTVSSDITGSNIKLFRLPFGALDNMLIPLYNRTVPFNIITTLSTYVSSLGDVYISGTLEAGQYDLCGAYFEV